MLALLALALWIVGLVTMTVAPLLGAGLAAGGFVVAGASMRRPEDLEWLVGLAFLGILAVGVIRLAAWLLG